MAKATLITSPSNPLLKEIRRAAAHGGRTSDGLVVAETFHLLEEALRSDLPVPVVVAAEGVRSAVESHVRGLDRVRVMVVSDDLLGQVVSTETAQGVLALVKLPDWKLENVFGGVPLVVVLDGVQDPGNAGAIVRASEAFGASGALFLKGSVSPYHPRTIRGAAGSLFRIPFLAGPDPDLVLAALKQRKVRVFAADPRGDVVLARADLRGPAALVIGSEARGVRESLAHGSIKLRIPTRGVESLNAAVAAGVLLYEAARQRSRA
jgi:TrmH family RNA methyltransferase